MRSRSLLFVPTNSEKMLSKINEINTDIIILDLEDAVALDEKDMSRTLVKQNIFNFKEKNIFIRINDIESDHYEKDMKLLSEIISASSVKGIMVPKCHSNETIQIVSEKLQVIENEKNRINKLKIIPLVEDAIGIYQLESICKDSSRILSIAFGAEDFKSDLGIRNESDDDALLYAKSKLVIISKVYNLKKPIDTVYTEINNIEEFKNQCRKGKAIGFGGKLLIHPNQIDVSNEVFTPTLSEYKHAKAIVSLAEKELGVFNYKGEMIDKPIVENMKKLIEEYKETLT